MGASNNARAAPAIAGDDPHEQLPGRLSSKNITAPHNLQQFRAAWISRHCAVSPTIATDVAAFHFGEVAP